MDTNEIKKEIESGRPLLGRVDINEIKKEIESGRPLLLKDYKGKLFFYFDKFKMLIPIQQDFEREYDVDADITAKSTRLRNIPASEELIKANHATEIFAQLKKIETLEN